jgi:parallel beta-helix repeat protein
VSSNAFNNNAVGVHINYGSYVAPTVTGNTYSYSTDGDVRAAGNIYDDVSWNEGPGTVYRVAPGTGVLGILENGYLTITDGIIVKVNPDKVIWVQTGGVLVATGVTFTATDENNEWDGIWFFSGDSRSRLENCVIELVKGRSTDGYAMVRVEGGVSDAYPSIIGCTIGNGGAQRGIYVGGGASPQILNNTFNGFSDAAVFIQSTKTTELTGNTFYSNAVGVHINYSSSNTAPTVTGNTYFNSTDADVRVAGNIYANVAWNEGPGTIYLVAPTNNVLGIEGNGYLTITNGIIVKVNPDKIFWIRSGGVMDATGVTFTAADENNEWNAIWFYSGDSRSRLENCVIERAEGRSTEGYAMVYINGGGSPNIIGCTLGNGGAQRGIHVASSSPQILGNTISGFSDYGIYVTGSQSAPFIAGNIITGNDRGIGSFMQSKNIVSRVNCIEGNIEYGFFTGESYIYSVANARYNWWGSSTGPTITENPSGTGDEITTKVDYLPFFGSIADIEPDGIWDEWEIQNFTNTITATEISDFDDDGLIDSGEFLYGTDPKNSDSDGDGVFDGLEIQCFLNPLLSGDFGLDSDNDGFSDLRELISGTDQWDSGDIPEIIADREPQPSGDGDVDGKDLIAFIAEIGSFNCSNCQFDLDHDGDVDRADLFLFTEDYGRIY